MAQGNYEGWTLEQVATAILAGDPGTFDDAIKQFDDANTAYSALVTDGSKAVSAVAGVPAIWVGPGAEAFLEFSGRFFEFVGKAGEPLASYKGALAGAKTALTTAQGEVKSLQTQVGDLKPEEVDQEAFNEAAVTILNTLAGSYRDAIGQ